MITSVIMKIVLLVKKKSTEGTRKHALVECGKSLSCFIEENSSL